VATGQELELENNQLQTRDAKRAAIGVSGRDTIQCQTCFPFFPLFSQPIRSHPIRSASARLGLFGSILAKWVGQWNVTVSHKCIDSAALKRSRVDGWWYYGEGTPAVGIISRRHLPVTKVHPLPLLSHRFPYRFVKTAGNMVNRVIGNSSL